MNFRKDTHPLTLRSDWLELVRKYQDQDPAVFALRYGGKKEGSMMDGGKETGLPVKEIAEQIRCYPRAGVKLGPMHRPGMIYRKEALEQASGYATAVFRARRWLSRLAGESLNDRSADETVKQTGFRSVSATDTPGEHLAGAETGTPLVADLTGGLGIDTAGWALGGARVICGEKDGVLVDVARHNHHLLKIDDRITYFRGDAAQWLQACASGTEPEPDLLYLDPSRRVRDKRVIFLEESEPSIPEILPLIRAATSRYLIKLSPMIDITRLEKQLTDCHEITVVSAGREVKELLADCRTERSSDDKYERGAISAEKPHEVFPVNETTDAGRVLRRAVLLNRSGEVVFEAASTGKYQTGYVRFEEPDFIKVEPETQAIDASEGLSAENYLFDPDPALFKADLVDVVAGHFGLRRINPGIGYLTGPRDLPGFPGHRYQIRRIHPYKPKKMRRYLLGNGIRKVHIHQRGFPVTVNQLYRKLDCTMGEDAHLIATMDHSGACVIIISDIKSGSAL